MAGRPLVNLSFALNYRFGQLNVRGYRIVNLAIHVIAGLVLFAFLRRVFLLPKLAPRVGARATDLAFASALLWTLHPLQTEAISYVAQRTESLMGLCYLLTLYCSLRALHPARTTSAGASRSSWMVAAFIACTAGMLSKESMVTAPVAVVLIDRALVFDSWRAMLAARRRLYVSLAATWVVLAALLVQVPRTSAGFGTTVTPWTYLLNQARLIPHYLTLAFWPRALVLDYGLPQPLTIADVLVPGLIVLVLLAATVAALVYRPVIGLLGAWFFITLAPTSSFVPIATEVAAERRMYLPLAAIVIGAVLVWDQLIARGRAAISVIVLCVLCGLMIAGVVLRNREYASPLAMAHTIVDRWPNGRAHYLLGTALIGAGRHEEGMAQLHESARDYPGALFAIGTELLVAGEFEKGVQTLEMFIQALPSHMNVIAAHEMIGRAYASRGGLSRAAEEAREVVRLAPQYARGHDLLGRVLAARGQFGAAAVEFEELLRLDPGNVEARRNLAAVQKRAFDGDPPVPPAR